MKAWNGGLFFLLLLVSSCVTHKKMLLLNHGTKEIQDSLERRLVTEYQLQSGDILDIKVSSMDPSSVAIFNKTIGGSSNNMANPTALYVNGYLIDHFGAINLPLIGDVEVEGITIDSLNHLLDTKLSEYFKYYTVEAKLVNYRVSVLGEVKNPGTQQIYNGDINLLQALSDAGGITTYGNRRKVKVIRKAFQTNESIVLDLSKEEIIYSEFFYLMPNDVIYIEPYRSKAVSINVPLFALLISATSLAILIISTVGR